MTRWPVRSSGSGHLAERQLQREARRRQQARPVQRAAERARELAVRDRHRRGRVDGPATAGVSTIHRTISIQSMRWIHDMYCRPDPIGPPAKKRNGGIIFGSAPPDRSSTMPDRSGTTRVMRSPRGALPLPTSYAEVREEVVAGRRRFRSSRSSSRRAVVADAAAADEDRRRRRRPRHARRPGCAWGRCGCRAARALRCGVHRLSAIPVPARLMTASAPSSAAAHGPLWPSGFQPTRVTPGTPVPGS